MKEDGEKKPEKNACPDFEISLEVTSRNQGRRQLGI